MYQNIIPFYDWIILHCSIHNILYIYSTVAEHLSCFTFSPIINHAAVNTGIQVCLGPCLQLFSRAQLLGDMVIPCLAPWGTTDCFPQGFLHFAFSPAVYEGSNFSSFLPTLATFSFVLFCFYSHPRWYEVIFWFFSRCLQSSDISHQSV